MVCNTTNDTYGIDMRRAFSPLCSGLLISWGVAPGWYGAAPLALDLFAMGSIGSSQVFKLRGALPQAGMVTPSALEFLVIYQIGYCPNA
jgi:hypothetical protein